MAGLAVVLVTFLPEALFWVERGREWQGSYSCVDPDEMAYSAYLAAIIRGKPRRNNPYIEEKRGYAHSKKESLFSIQFIPPYVLGLGARLIRISASTTFILLIPICAFASSLAVFWLLWEVTRNSKISALGVLIVLLCGIIISENPFAAEKHYYTFAFLRRYIPALPFPFFFLFGVFVYRALTRKMKSELWAAGAGLILSFLIYSYFYLWTAAVAWLICLVAVWLIIRPDDKGTVLKSFAIVGFISVIALIPYSYLLLRRTETLDVTYALVLTRFPDFFRLTELVAAGILVVIGVYASRGTLALTTPAVVFALSCLLAPFIVFNQQVLTGRSLQPFHYEQFIINYLILAGAIVTFYLLYGEPKRQVFWIATSLGVGVATAFVSAGVTTTMNQRRDEAVAIYNLIKEGSDTETGTVLFDQPLLAVAAPTIGDIPTLWSPYSYTFGSTSNAEEKERFFQFLYFMGVDAKQLEQDLRTERLYRATLFGLPRVNKRLSERFEPITDAEVRAEVESYAHYMVSFSRVQALRWPISHLVVRDDRPHNLSHFDRWYERDSGVRIGKAIVYRVRSKLSSPSGVGEGNKEERRPQ